MDVALPEIPFSTWLVLMTVSEAGLVHIRSSEFGSVLAVSFISRMKDSPRSFSALTSEGMMVESSLLR
jgi:hypothetical protein